jgi:hypothetical protein
MTKEDWPIDQLIPVAQKNYETAKEVVAELLNMPDNSDDKCDTIRHSLVDDNEREKYDKWIASGTKHSKVEGGIMQYEGVSEIMWVPDNPMKVLKASRSDPDS